MSFKSAIAVALVFSTMFLPGTARADDDLFVNLGDLIAALSFGG